MILNPVSVKRNRLVRGQWHAGQLLSVSAASPSFLGPSPHGADNSMHGRELRAYDSSEDTDAVSCAYPAEGRISSNAILFISYKTAGFRH